MISQRLLKLGAKLKIYDPKVSEEKILNDLDGYSNFRIYDSADYAIKDCNAILLLVNWKSFEKLDFSGKKVYNTTKLYISNQYYSIGKKQN